MRGGCKRGERCVPVATDCCRRRALAADPSHVPVQMPGHRSSCLVHEFYGAKAASKRNTYCAHCYCFVCDTLVKDCNNWVVHYQVCPSDCACLQLGICMLSCSQVSSAASLFGVAIAWDCQGGVCSVDGWRVAVLRCYGAWPAAVVSLLVVYRRLFRRRHRGVHRLKWRYFFLMNCHTNNRPTTKTHTGRSSGRSMSSCVCLGVL